MKIEFEILGYGFFFCIFMHNFMEDRFTIVAWSIMCKYMIWRGESHSRGDGVYHYRCFKNGEQVENISFRSPIVHNTF